MAQSKDVVTDLMQSFLCKSFFFPNDSHKMVSITTDSTLSEALKLMIENHIMSIPVVEDLPSRRPRYVLSLIHIIEHFFKIFKEEDFKGDLQHKLHNWIHSKSSDIVHKKVSDIEQSADYRLDDAYCVEDSKPLLEAAQLMIQKHSHRVIVLDSHGGLATIISQSRILELISVLVPNLPQANKTVGELSLGLKAQVFSINESEPAYKAFQLMLEKNVHGVAVVNNKGELSGEISVSDFKLIGYNMKYWNLLKHSITQYLKEVAETRGSLRSHMFTWLKEGTSTAVLKCKTSSSLFLVIRLMTTFGVHRLFIVDDNNKPIGVISIIDILKLLIPQL